MQLKEPPINRATIEAVAQLIAERFDPVQVILFGSHARGNAGSHSDIDLLVVLDSLDDWPKEGNPIRRAIGEDFILPVDVLVTTPERLAQQRDDPYSFFNTALESKVILHARPAPPEDWFEKAEQDLEMAHRALDGGTPLPAMACYHCQQCAEKYLKGYLVYVSKSFRPVHDLFYLTQQCAESNPAFEEIASTAQKLMRYGGGIRYPRQGFEDPDEDEGRRAIKLAESVASFVKQNLPS